MKVAALTRYGRQGASSRLRTFQYAGPLAERGIAVDVLPFFDDAYLRRLYAGAPARGAVASAFGRRLAQARAARTADLVWLEKEALPWLPWPAERALLPGRVPLVSDYDDAVFHRYDLHGNGAVRALLGRKIDRVMAASALVMAGNAYLAARAERAGARRVEIVPTVVDTDTYATDPLPSPDGRSRIGWIGTPSTWAAYMAPMLPMLTALAAETGARLRIVGGGKGVAAHPEVESLDWTEAGEAVMIRGMDIGLMPLDDSPWSRGKCGYKLIQYMACGVPVIASPVGVNAEIVEHGVNGFLATTEAEWRGALTTLLADPGLRAGMGRAGRARVEARYALKVWAPRVADLLREVAEARRDGRA